jgi:hypothetical protein
VTVAALGGFYSEKKALNPAEISFNLYREISEVLGEDAEILVLSNSILNHDDAACICVFN